MSPRKTILAELNKIQSTADAQPTAPSTLRGFSGNETKYQQAVNDLLKDRLINGQKGTAGSMEIAINPARIADVRKELRPFFLRPAFLAATVLIVATVGFFAV